MAEAQTRRRATVRQPALDSKRQRDAIRDRWRAAIISDFGSVNAFRYAWPAGTHGQRVAETVSKFLQKRARTLETERHKGVEMSTVLAFAEMVGRQLQFLLTGEGPERVGETLPGRQLEQDLAAACMAALDRDHRDWMISTETQINARECIKMVINEVVASVETAKVSYERLLAVRRSNEKMAAESPFQHANMVKRRKESIANPPVGAEDWWHEAWDRLDGIEPVSHLLSGKIASDRARDD